MKKSYVLGGASAAMALALAVSGMSLAQDAIAKRREFMKSVGAAAKQSNEMIKGERAFDAKAAAEALTKVSTGFAEYLTLYPKGTETGGETTASPKIWEDRKGFEEKGQAFAKAAASAAEAAGKGKDAFAEAFKTVGGACKGCHETFRVQKK